MKLRLFTLVLAAAALSLAAVPPSQVRYEGVLRDLSGHPLSGAFDMELRLFDAPTGGNEIVIDRHTGSGAVTVAGGAFSVELGGGTLSDGSGAGTYSTITEVFLDYRDVYLQVRVGADTLTPMTHVLAVGQALNSGALGGRRAPAFLDISPAAQIKSGRLTVDDSSASAGYGFMMQSAANAALGASLKGASGRGYLGFGDTGIWGEGNSAGAYFQSRNATGSAFVGYGNVGVQGDGRASGAIFTQSDFNGLALVARDGLGGSFYGVGAGTATAAQHDFGLVGNGRFPGAGGRFSDPYYTGEARAGSGDSGLVAWGAFQGGEFRDTNNAGLARLGFGAIGVYGAGSFVQDNGLGGGGYFQDVGASGRAFLARGAFGLDAYGVTGGRFSNSSGPTVDVRVAHYAEGIDAFGRYLAAEHTGHDGPAPQSNIAWTPYTEPVTHGSHSVFGFEPKAFVQNHPGDPDKSVVYVAIEGDEAGTYTRGQARLVGGVAHVHLDRSFALATDPDVGLTASVTPRRDAVSLSIDSLTTDTLVVRGPKGADVLFDYVVFGLRIGFETHATIQPRHVEGPPHVPADYPDADRPGTGSALERWKTVRIELGETRPIDLARTRRLVSLARRPGQVVPAGGPGVAPSLVVPADAAYTVAVADTVRVGDLLATDPNGLDRAFVLAGALEGQTVVGIAAGDAAGTQAPLALAGSVVACHVDATEAPIARGDLLVASPIPGHARRAGGSPAPGTVVAQALEAIAGGTGTIKVRVLTQ